MEDSEATMDDIENRMSHSSVSNVALGSAIFAVLAAITALLSNYHSNEAVIDQIQASDQWGYYQAKGIKGNMVINKVDLLTSLGKIASQNDLDKIGQYKKEQDEISENAREKERSSNLHVRHHMVLARAVILFQVAIAISAISILTRRNKFWHASLLAASGGLFFLVQGVFLKG
ncbi:MAG: DUF4337 domain-containing protein [Bdellovibrionia bacterium]